VVSVTLGFFFSSRRRHTRSKRDWSSDVCSSDLGGGGRDMQVNGQFQPTIVAFCCNWCSYAGADLSGTNRLQYPANVKIIRIPCRSEEHTSELQSRFDLVCRLLLEKKKKTK